MFAAWVRDGGIIVATCALGLGLDLKNVVLVRPTSKPRPTATLSRVVTALSARGFYSSLTPKVKVPSARGFYSSLTPKVKALSARGFYSGLTPKERGPKEDLAKKINDSGGD
ncbi:hypothetical protein BT67DRAFT_436731 [Trichocladium antarcticum]|uniref:Uncharacterized protein n=1 Tax=Trichocladium antarcticum TaxID=1450529 RepID=A0AAN6ZB01_9PEZI|nr:hypothetical protein BT67DRAFT_436731 [Trichocladium antarcticum]